MEGRGRGGKETRSEQARAERLVAVVERWREAAVGGVGGACLSLLVVVVGGRFCGTDRDLVFGCSGRYPAGTLQVVSTVSGVVNKLGTRAEAAVQEKSARICYRLIVGMPKSRPKE
jgi:hypothetical protein